MDERRRGQGDCGGCGSDEQTEKRRATLGEQSLRVFVRGVGGCGWGW
jgi:hypothetical protein